MALGSAVAPALTGPLASQFPRPLVFVAYGALGILWCVAYCSAVPDAPAAGGRPSPPPAWGPRDWLTPATSVPMIPLCGQQFFRACGMAFFYTWFPTSLQETRGVELAEAGLLTGAVGLGGMADGVLGGLSSDWVLRRTGNRRLSRQGLAAACAPGESRRRSNAQVFDQVSLLAGKSRSSPAATIRGGHRAADRPG